MATWWRARRRRLGAAAVIVARVAAVAIATLALQYLLWPPDPDVVTPLHVTSKALELVGEAGAVTVALAAVGAAAYAFFLVGDAITTWWRSLWLVCFVPLFSATVVGLARTGWDLANWESVSYLQVAVPPLVASIALQARPHRRSRPAADEPANTRVSLPPAGQAGHRAWTGALSAPLDFILADVEQCYNAPRLTTVSFEGVRGETL